MRLTDLNPKLSDTGFLVFDCPKCSGQDAHRILVHLSPAVDRNGRSWGHTGEYPGSITVTPSIDCTDEGRNNKCWHGSITEGMITGIV